MGFRSWELFEEGGDLCYLYKKWGVGIKSGKQCRIQQKLLNLKENIWFIR
jgi:hypothetical protein